MKQLKVVRKFLSGGHVAHGTTNQKTNVRLTKFSHIVAIKSGDKSELSSGASNSQYRL